MFPVKKRDGDPSKVWRRAPLETAHAFALGRAETAPYHRRRWPHSSGHLSLIQPAKSTATRAVMSAIEYCRPATNSRSARHESSSRKNFATRARPRSIQRGDLLAIVRPGQGAPFEGRRGIAERFRDREEAFAFDATLPLGHVRAALRAGTHQWRLRLQRSRSRRRSPSRPQCARHRRARAPGRYNPD